MKNRQSGYKKFLIKRHNKNGRSSFNKRDSAIKLVDKDFFSREELMSFAEAKVDRENVKALSAALKRDVKQEKEDDRDYNVKFIRKDDVQVLNLMECGIKNDFEPGDTMKVQSISDMLNGNFWLHSKLIEVMEQNGDYGTLPFCSPISEDIRSKYLLKTDSSDNYEQIKLELDARSYDFCSKEEWNILSNAMKEGISRIEKEPVIFLNPLDEGVAGEARPLSEDERKKFNLPKNDIADFRHDTHDMVSLKMLLLAMRGEEIDQMSPFAGAFSKYMPELNKMGVRAVIFLVRDNKLSEIKLDFFKGERSVPYSAVEAGISLIEKYGESLVKELSEKDRAYVCVNGFVVHPGVDHWGLSEEHPINDKVIPAAETIMFSKKDNFNGPLATRMYFYPYKPTDLNPFYQHMSVIYGESDHVLNSCAYDPKREFWNKEYKSNYALKLRHDFADHEPAVKAARHHYVDDISPPEVLAEEKEFDRLCKQITDSYYAENIETVHKYIDVAKSTEGFPNESAELLEKTGLLNNFRPLTSRFLISKYLTKENSGLTPAAQVTVWNRFQVFDIKKALNELTMGIKINQALISANNAIKAGESATKAFKDHIMKPLDELREFRKNK